MRGDGVRGMEANFPGHRGGQYSLAGNPGLSHCGLVAAENPDGLGELLFMVVSMATSGRGLACYCSFSEKVESSLLWAGDGTSDPEAGQSRPDP